MPAYGVSYSVAFRIPQRFVFRSGGIPMPPHGMAGMGMAGMGMAGIGMPAYPLPAYGMPLISTNTQPSG